MYDRVVIALDGTEPSERVVPWVRRVLGRDSTVLYLVTTRPQPKMAVSGGRAVAYIDQLEDATTAEALAGLSRLASRLAEHGFHVVPTVRFGDPAEAVLDVAREVNAGLIALASRGIRGVRRVWTRSITNEIVRRAPVPVLVVRETGQRAV